MKILDWEKKGNVVRLYLGDDTENDWWGDDWDDRPYEHNAGTVYMRFVKEYVDVAFPFNWIVQEPAEDWHYHYNSPYCKEDFKNRQAPIFVAYCPEEDSWSNPETYSEIVPMESCVKVYMGDKFINGIFGSVILARGEINEQ